LHEGIKIFLIDKKIVPQENIFVIPNGIETSGVQRVILSEKKELTVLFLGWLTHNKGIDLLIEAAAKIKFNDVVKFRIEIYGPEMEDGIKATLISLIEKHVLSNVVTIHDTVHGDEKQKVLMNTDIFVLPTRSEGFPNAILEAMLLGLPVVASDIAPLNYIIENNETGLLFKLNDAVALSGCLTRLINDFTLRNKIGTNAANRIIENYDIKKITSQVKDLYLHLAAR
jgi:glycosyltransferase involved in cell wall biosynthesis